MQMRRSLLSITFLLTILSVIAIFILWPRRVYGVVSDELDGEPISCAVILTGEQNFRSDQAGRYDLGWVHGALTLTVQAEGYLPARLSTPKGRFPGQRVLLHITLTPNTFGGTVCDAETETPLPGSTISAGGQMVVANEQGRYTLRRVRAGTSVNVFMPGYQPGAAIFNGQQVQDFALQPTETRILVLDLYTREPVPGAQVQWGPERFSTDANGAVIIKRLPKDTILSVQAAGYAPMEFECTGTNTISIALRPNKLKGVVRENDSGEPINGATVSIVSVRGVITSSVTGADGCYSFSDLPSLPITLVVAAAGYKRVEIPIGPVTELDVYLKPFEVKGIYIPFGILTNERRVHELLDLVDSMELNAIVVDVKSDRGQLAYPSAVREAQQSEAYYPRVMDINKFLKLCKEKGIYTIARLVTFKDSMLATAYPEWAVHMENGELWTDLEGSYWVDPFRVEVQDYNIAIAKEVAMLGFDELQFDYLRFPSDGEISRTKYVQESTLESRCKTIRDFCAKLSSALRPYGVLLSADFFGLTVWTLPEEDMGIGQRVIDIAPYMDYVSPMLYPSTFAPGSLGFETPLLHPYEIVYRSCIELTKRTKTKLRPWLQHYSWDNVTYGVNELRLQTKAANDAGTRGWMFWNAAGNYNAQAFDPESGSP